MRYLPPAAVEREKRRQDEINTMLVAQKAAKEATLAYQQQQSQALRPPTPGMGMGMGGMGMPGLPAPASMPPAGALAGLRPPTPMGMAAGASVSGVPPQGALSAPMGTPQPSPPSLPLPPGGGGGLGMGAGGAGGMAAASAFPAPSPPLTPFAQGGMVDAPMGATPGAIPAPMPPSTDPRSLKAAAPVPLLPGVLSAEQILDAIGRALAGEPVDPNEYNDVPTDGGMGMGPASQPDPEDAEGRAFVAALKENPPTAPRRFEQWLVNGTPATPFEADVQETFTQSAESAGLLWGVARAAAKEDGMLGQELQRMVGGGKKPAAEPVPIRAPQPTGRAA